jgi:hypothetical protein
VRRQSAYTLPEEISMSTQHTPGPWTISRDTGSKGERYIWMDGDYFGGHAIATVHDKVPESAEANARLLAAAPDLLAALQAILETLDNMTTSQFQHGADKPARDLARAAIAKALEEVTS